MNIVEYLNLFCTTILVDNYLIYHTRPYDGSYEVQLWQSISIKLKTVEPRTLHFTK